MKSSTLDDATLERLIGIGDAFIPSYLQLPALSQTADIVTAIDKAIGCRPDLLDDLRRGIAANPNLSASEAAIRLFDDDNAALNAIGTILSGAYLMSPSIRSLIGYPGQQRVERSNNDLSEIPNADMMAAVSARGTICRTT